MVLKSLRIHKGHKHERLPRGGPSGQGAKPPTFELEQHCFYLFTYWCSHVISWKRKSCREGKRGIVVQWAWCFSFAKWESSRDLLHKNVCIINTTVHLKFFRCYILCYVLLPQIFKKRNLSETPVLFEPFSLCHVLTASFTQEKQVPTTRFPHLHLALKFEEYMN